jgi:hypothetical protein
MKIGFDQTKSIADIGILISDGPIYKNIFSFETTLPIGTKVYRNDVYNVFVAIQSSIMDLLNFKHDALF